MGSSRVRSWPCSARSTIARSGRCPGRGSGNRCVTWSKRRIRINICGCQGATPAAGPRRTAGAGDPGFAIKKTGPNEYAIDAGTMADVGGGQAGRVQGQAGVLPGPRHPGRRRSPGQQVTAQGRASRSSCRGRPVRIRAFRPAGRGTRPARGAGPRGEARLLCRAGRRPGRCRAPEVRLAPGGRPARSPGSPRERE